MKNERDKKYTFKNGAIVFAPDINSAYEAIKRDYGFYIPVIKVE